MWRHNSVKTEARILPGTSFLFHYCFISSLPRSILQFHATLPSIPTSPPGLFPPYCPPSFLVILFHILFNLLTLSAVPGLLINTYQIPLPRILGESNTGTLLLVSRVYSLIMSQLRDIWLRIVDDSGASHMASEAPPDPFAQSPQPDEKQGRTSGFLPNPFAAFVSSKRPPRPQARLTTPGSSEEIAEHMRDASYQGSAKVDVLAWLARATLDAIGEAGMFADMRRPIGMLILLS